MRDKDGFFYSDEILSFIEFMYGENAPEIEIYKTYERWLTGRGYGESVDTLKAKHIISRYNTFKRFLGNNTPSPQVHNHYHITSYEEPSKETLEYMMHDIADQHSRISRF